VRIMALEKNKMRSVSVWSQSIRIGCAIGLIAPAAFGQRMRNVSLTRPVELTGESIQFKTFGGAEATTLPPPQVFHATRTANGSSVQIEMFDPIELWVAPQMLGYWKTKEGPSCRMAVVSVTPLQLPPGRDGGRLVLERTECDGYAAKVGPVDGNDPAALSAWLSFFGSGPLEIPLRSLKDTIALHGIRVGSIASSNCTRIAILFSLKPGMHGADPKRVYAALFDLLDKPAAEEAMEALTKAFLPTIKPTGRPKAFAAAPAGEAKKEESSVRTRSRDVVLQTIRGLPKWWVLETERYILVSDMAGSERSFVKRISEDLIRFCAIYEKLIPPMKKIEAISAVRVFANSKDYLQYVGEGSEWTAGMWNPGRLELMLRPSDWMQGKAKKENVGEILRHEALHQYLFYAFPGSDVSVWYNEGHSTFMEGVELTPSEVRIGEVEHYARAVEDMIKKGDVPLQNLFKMSYQDFYNGDGTEVGRSQNYALAWSLIYYLRKGTVGDKASGFSRILLQYEAALRAGKKGEEATAAALEGVAPNELNDDWRAFWKSSLRRGAANRVDILSASR